MPPEQEDDIEDVVKGLLTFNHPIGESLYNMAMLANETARHEEIKTKQKKLNTFLDECRDMYCREIIRCCVSAAKRGNWYITRPFTKIPVEFHQHIICKLTEHGINISPSHVSHCSGEFEDILVYKITWKQHN